MIERANAGDSYLEPKVIDEMTTVGKNLVNPACTDSPEVAGKIAWFYQEFLKKSDDQAIVCRRRGVL